MSNAESHARRFRADPGLSIADAIHPMDTRCEGHPAGPFDPMGETVYCDGSCQPEEDEDPTAGFLYEAFWDQSKRS